MPDPLVVLLANQFRQDLLARDMASILEMSRAWLQIQQVIEEDILKLAQEMSEIREAGGVVSREAMLKLERYRQLQAQALVEINRATQQIAGQIETAQQINALAGIDNAANLIGAVGLENEVVLTFNRIGIEAVENIVSIARAGQPLNVLLQTVAPNAVEGMTNLLIRNTAIGRNPRETARLAVEKGFVRGLDQALLVARDQQVRAYRLASLQQYQASGVVQAYQRLAAKNERTCPACLALDGEIYQTSDLPELHPQDRCSMIPLVTGVPKPSFKLGSDWFNEQPPDVQRNILGAGRYDAWQDGQFEFSQLAKKGDDKTWGPTVRVASLEELTQ